MARLIPQGQGGNSQPFDLRLGLNRVGRAPANDIVIDHASVSAHHCELVLDGDGLTLHDLHSTNGTYVDGQLVQSARLEGGQFVRLGSVEIRVEYSDPHVFIPEFRPPALPPVIKLPTGEKVCINHDAKPAMWQCTRCGHLLCNPCIHQIRRRGGITLYLCPDCSGPCELLPEYAQQKKTSWLASIRKTLKRTLVIPGLRRKSPPRKRN